MELEKHKNDTDKWILSPDWLKCCHPLESVFSVLQSAEETWKTSVTEHSTACIWNDGYMMFVQ